MSPSRNLKIPLHEISSATNKFSEANIIGKGGYGVVYRGDSKQHGMLAIKRQNRVLGQGDHEFGMEVALLSKLKHENLVSLIGFCAEHGEKILVYKYEANKSLDKHLGSKDLSWMRRLQICLGTACGLRYLHKEIGSEHIVIHRDIKSSNILLDENWKAKISDFGLSKFTLTNSANSLIFSVPCGTPGYVDPQMLYGAITQKSDIYSFGVVLYEVLFGKLVAVPEFLFGKLVAVPAYHGDHRFTIKMAKKHYEEKTLHMMIDPDLRSEIDSDSLSTFSTIAYHCLQKRTEDRPTISLVVEALKTALDYQEVSTIEILYDVYIIFRVETQYIVDRLCDSLKRAGLSTYMDNTKSSTNELLSAIKQSRSYIIFFSKNFGADSWNVNLVAEIIKCVRKRGSVVIPVYWDVSSSDLREQEGYLGEQKGDLSFEKWMNAFVAVTNVPRFYKSDFKSPARLEDVADKIRRQLLDHVPRKSHRRPWRDLPLMTTDESYAREAERRKVLVQGRLEGRERSESGIRRQCRLGMLFRGKR